MYPGAHKICGGDFNARTANVQVDPAPNDESVPCSHIHRRTSIFVENRVSRDMTRNEFGGAFLNLCACFDLYILNGFKLGDKAGEFTNIFNTDAVLLTIVQYQKTSLVTLYGSAFVKGLNLNIYHYFF